MLVHEAFEAELAEPVQLGTVHLRAGPIRIAQCEPLRRPEGQPGAPAG
jgi:hypothetical protein